MATISPNCRSARRSACMAMPPTVTNAACRRSTSSGTGTTWLMYGAATSACPLAA